MPIRRILAAVLALALTATLHAQMPASPHTPEEAAAANFDRIQKNPLLLEAFLRQMPKGGDLHIHLTGAVYAETFLHDAAADGLCIDKTSLSFVTPHTPSQCASGQTAAADLLKSLSIATNQSLYDKLVDSFSMRSFVPTSSFSGHDQFFATFDRFHGLNKSHSGEWLAELANRAAAQNETYLEIMNTPDFSHAAALSAQIGWPSDTTLTPDFAAMRDKLLAAGLRNDVPAITTEIAGFESSRDTIDHCGTPSATPGCTVNMKYLYQVLRALPPQIVFAQTLLGFETVATEIASGHPRYVGINFVQPEDGFNSMSNYHLQMQMLDYLHSVYPQVQISLHAGELAPGLVPPEGLRFHIRQAVDLGHAERIGHGVDVMYEDHPDALLAELARKHVLVEINLTSNDVILGISGTHHPLPEYLAANVPVALSTDDEGVSRIDLTHEYVRAVTDYGLTYFDLKQMSRASLEHSFLPGPSLWANAENSVPEKFSRYVAACANQRPSLSQSAAAKPSAACVGFLATSEKATAQWDLESRYRAFETGIK